MTQARMTTDDTGKNDNGRSCFTTKALSGSTRRKIELACDTARERCEWVLALEQLKPVQLPLATPPLDHGAQRVICPSHATTCLPESCFNFASRRVPLRATSPSFDLPAPLQPYHRLCCSGFSVCCSVLHSVAWPAPLESSLFLLTICHKRYFSYDI